MVLSCVGVVVGDEVGYVKALRIFPHINQGSENDEVSSYVVARYGTGNKEDAVNDLSLNCIGNGTSHIIASTGKIHGGETQLKILKLGSESLSLKEEVRAGKISSPSRFCALHQDDTAKLLIYDINGTILSYPDNALSKIQGPLSNMVSAKASTLIAAGGKENDLKLYDYEYQKQLFSAKNVPHDELDMRVPVWITGITFLKHKNDGENLIATCTGYSQVRIYDTRVQQRPVKEMALSNMRHLTCMLSIDENSVAVSDTTGRIAKLNLQKMVPIGNFHGCGGSIRSLDLHPTKPLLVASGLDRFVRVYSIKSTKLFGEIYVKQRINAVAFCQDLEQYDTTQSDREKRKHLGVNNNEEADVEFRSEDEVEDLDLSSGDEILTSESDISEIGYM